MVSHCRMSGLHGNGWVSELAWLVGQRQDTQAHHSSGGGRAWDLLFPVEWLGDRQVFMHPKTHCFNEWEHVWCLVRGEWVCVGMVWMCVIVVGGYKREGLRMCWKRGLFLISSSPEGVISLRRRVVRQRYNEKRPKPWVSPWSDHFTLPRTTYRRS